MKRVLMLATTVAMIEQFNKNNIELLNELGYVVDVAGNFYEGNPISDERLNQFKKWITGKGGQIYNIPIVRQPFALRKNIKAYKELLVLLTKNQYHFIHVHTPIGSIVGRMAAHKHHIKIIYTAHGFHFYKGAPFHNWLLFYPMEWAFSWWTDILITINREDYEFAKKHLHAKKTEYIPGVGINIDKFNMTSIDKNKLKREFGIPDNAILILSVGELNKNKNHQLVIKAIEKLHNPNIHYIICGIGNKQEELKLLIHQYGMDKQVHLLGFCKNMVEIYKSCDIFAFPSKREGLSVALMEAMAAGVPVVCSKIRGNVDLVDNGKGGFLVPFNNLPIFVYRLKEIIRMSEDDRNRMGLYSQKKIMDFNNLTVGVLMKKNYSIFSFDYYK